MQTSEAPPKINPSINPEVDNGRQTPLEIIQDRARRGYRPGVDDDGHKIGLTLDPGGYAGVVSLSMAKELEDSSLIDYFDAFYGLSAGGINAAYVANRQIDDGLYTYQELMPGRFTQKAYPPVRLDVLEDAVYKDKPLRAEEMVARGVPVVIGVTQLNPYRRLMIRSTDVTPEEFMKWVLRGCHLPLISGEAPKDEEGTAYSDATLSWMSPIQLAQEDGCSEIVSLANTVAEQPKKSKFSLVASGVATKLAIRATDIFMRRYDPATERREMLLASSNVGAYEKLLEERKAIAQHHFTGALFEDRGVTIERLHPASIDGLPGLLTGEKARLKVGIAAGRLAVEKAINTEAADIAAA